MVQISEKRISTIIEEIDYWKEHKLLPDVYCDFLLALYTNGEGNPNKKKEPGNRLAGMRVVQLLMLFLLLPFSFVTIYFTDFMMPVKVCVLGLFLLFSYWLTRINKKKENIFFHQALVISLLLVLFISIYLCTWFGVHQLIQLVIILTNMLFWYMLGRKYGVKYLKLVSGLAALFVILYMIL